jgi:hypothetical protein
VDWETAGAVTAIVFGAVGLQTFWIARELDGIAAKFADVKVSLDRIEGTVLTALDRRVTRLEERI